MMTEPHEKRNYTESGMSPLDLTSGQIRRDAYLYENREMLVRGITGVVRSYYFAFDSIPEYAQHTRSMTVLNEKIQTYAKEKIRLEAEANGVREEIKAMGEEPKLILKNGGAWWLILLGLVLLAYWGYAVILQMTGGYTPDSAPVTGIAFIDAVFKALPSFLLFPQAVYSLASGTGFAARSLANPYMQVFVLFLPLLLIISAIIRRVVYSRRRKKHEEDLKTYRETRAALEKKLSGIEQNILKDTKESALVSDELNNTQNNFLKAQLDEYHKLTGKYNSLLKYRSLIPEEYHTPAAMSEMVKAVTVLACDTWGEVLEMCDAKMTTGTEMPMDNSLLRQAAAIFHKDRCVVHMMSVCDNPVKLEALTKTWKTNKQANAEYLSYEKTLQAKYAHAANG